MKRQAKFALTVMALLGVAVALPASDRRTAANSTNRKTANCGGPSHSIAARD